MRRSGRNRFEYLERKGQDQSCGEPPLEKDLGDEGHTKDELGEDPVTKSVSPKSSPTKSILRSEGWGFGFTNEGGIKSHQKNEFSTEEYPESPMGSFPRERESAGDGWEEMRTVGGEGSHGLDLNRYRPV